MQPTRRRYLAAAGLSIGAGVAGCLSTGSNVRYPEAEAESDETVVDDDPDESEQSDGPDVEAINERLAEETDEIYAELRWFETEYEPTNLTYRGRLRDVAEATKDVLETLEAQEELSAESIAALRDFADEKTSNINELFEPQFDDHVNFAALNRRRFETINEFRDRQDWERVDRELSGLRNDYRTVALRREVEDRYSPNPIENRLFEWLGGERDSDFEDRMFELRYISDQPDHHANDGREPGYGVYVLEDADRSIRHLETPIGERNREARSTIDNDFAPFVESTDRSYRLYVRIHDVEESGNIDPEETDSFAVYGQRYTDTVAAASAFDAVMAEKDLEARVEWGDEIWNRVLYTRESQRYYAYFIRANSFLFAVGPSRTPWEERDDDWDELLDGSWMNP